MTTQADLEKLLDTFNKAAIEFFDAAVLAGLRDMYLSVDPRDEAALKRVDEQRDRIAAWRDAKVAEIEAMRHSVGGGKLN
jgi:hypothetical protein